MGLTDFIYVWSQRMHYSDETPWKNTEDKKLVMVNEIK